MIDRLSGPVIDGGDRVPRMEERIEPNHPAGESMGLPPRGSPRGPANHTSGPNGDRWPHGARSGSISLSTRVPNPIGCPHRNPAFKLRLRPSSLVTPVKSGARPQCNPGRQHRHAHTHTHPCVTTTPSILPTLGDHAPSKKALNASCERQASARRTCRSGACKAATPPALRFCSHRRGTAAHSLRDPQTAGRGRGTHCPASTPHPVHAIDGSH